MTMPHKTCPHCGQPAVLSIPQCRRCGFVYPAAPYAAASSGFEARERPGNRPAAARQFERRALPWLVAVLVCSALFAVVAAARLVQGAGRRALLPGRERNGPALDFSPSDASSPPGGPSLFVESNSSQETPQLNLHDWSGANLTLTLRDRYGHVYRAVCPRFGEASLQVPAGYYSVSLDSDNPHIRPNWGDATFRKFKAYQADFVVGHRDERLHLGE